MLKLNYGILHYLKTNKENVLLDILWYFPPPLPLFIFRGGGGGGILNVSLISIKWSA